MLYEAKVTPPFAAVKPPNFFLSFWGIIHVMYFLQPAVPCSLNYGSSEAIVTGNGLSKVQTTQQKVYGISIYSGWQNFWS